MARPLVSITLATGNDPVDSAYLSASADPKLNHPSSETRKAAAETRAKARFSLAGKAALITGGYGALGFECGLALLEHGLRYLAVVDIRSDASKLTTLRNRAGEAKVEEFIGDLSVDEYAQAVVHTYVEGTTRLDIVLCCTGIVGVEHALDMTPEHWRRMLDINTTSGFVIAQAAAKKMIELARSNKKESCNASIVFISSISAHHVNFPQPQAAYNVSKAAVSHMTKSLAAEWAIHGIRVNSISPGYLDTALNEGVHLDEAKKIWYARTPLGRMGRVDEIAGAVVMLCSPAGSYFTGSDLIVDGGLTTLQ